MPQTPAPEVRAATRPICVGLTCWRWQKTKARSLVRMAQRAGVNIQLTERIQGLRRHIEAEVSGAIADTDRFIGEFVRHG